MKKSARFSTLILALTAASALSQPFDFIAIGDLPYNDDEKAMLTVPNGSLAKSINELKPPFVIHYGDIKQGDLDCSDAVLEERFELLASLYPKRLVYTPGDNEWTDCDRSNLDKPLDELERFDKLRSLFFQGDGLKMTSDISSLTRQKNVPENTIWQHQEVLFSTIHLPGTNNGRAGIFKSDVNKALDLADFRDEKNRQWLVRAFNQAEKQQAKALVISFQADIFRPPENGITKPCNDKERIKCNGFVSTRQFLEFAAANAKLPVLLIHGDTSNFCLDKPNEALAPNLWRLNGPGDYKVIDGVNISIDVGNKQQPFSVRTLLTNEAPPKDCAYEQ